jgi:hypothetical protein
MIDLILMQRVEKLGQMGELVKVKPGYARNFLLPQGKAIRANKANMARFEAQRAQLAAVGGGGLLEQLAAVGDEQEAWAPAELGGELSLQRGTGRSAPLAKGRLQVRSMLRSSLYS